MTQIGKEKYYTLEQAKKILGVSTDVLYNYVKNGALERVVPPGKKQGLYRVTEVERLARELQLFIIHRKNKPTQFEIVKTREEMQECLEVSQTLFGAGRRDLLDDAMKILEKNPETFYMIKDEDQVIGWGGMIPYQMGKINNVLAQTLPVKILPEDMETYEEGKTVDLYIVTIGIKPIFTREEKRSYGARLISGLAGVLENLGERGISIDTIAARSNTPDGIRVMRGIGFTEIEPLTPERRTFIIKVKESGNPFIMKYKEKLRKWQEDRTQLHQ